ncbi:MAG: M36 family metallopeptidase [Bacteroidetes bacterium]|nr:M36 family metallopeptidase [Bacteroidota bacterium]
MKYFALIVSLIVGLNLSSQKNTPSGTMTAYRQLPCKSSFDQIHFEGKNTTETIHQFLLSYLATLNDARSNLVLNYRHESLGGYHYSFHQTFSGVPVYQSEVKVNTNKQNLILSIFDNSYSTQGWRLNTETANEQSIIAFHPRSGEPVLAYIHPTSPFKEIIQTANEILYERDTRMYSSAVPDSTVSGRVFNPDPLTTAGKLYDTNTIYKHNNNANAPWIESQLQTVNFKTNFDGVKFTLEGPYVIISDFDTPNVAPATSTLPQFNYSRPNTGLEDVNAFYHANRFRDYVAGMGFTCANVRVNMDTHAAYGADQSFFSSSQSPPRIYFGTGGVPDAQDADVIIHEYGHFISDNASPASNVGYERTSLDEGLGDYLAAAYSRSINTFKEEWVFNWDGHNEFWNGRLVNSTKHYPNDMSYSSIYRDAEIWSSTLFQLNTDLGRDIMDRLILESHYNYAQNISMTDAAQLLISMDTILNNGANYCAIFKRLYERGLLAFRSNPCGISSVGESTDGSSGGFHFIQDGYSFTLTSSSDAGEPVQVDIYSLDGAKQLSHSKDAFFSNTYTYSNPFLSAGMYVVYVRNKYISGTFKWVKTF